MHENLAPKDQENAPSKGFPPVGTTVRIRYEGRERLAYLDSKGQWRDDLNGEVLVGKVRILGPYRAKTDLRPMSSRSDAPHQLTLGRDVEL